jgi:hypothetical protein
MIVVRRNEFLIQRPIRYLYYLTKRHGIHTKLANTTLCRCLLDKGRTMVFSGQIRLKFKIYGGTREAVGKRSGTEPWPSILTSTGI